MAVINKPAENAALLTGLVVTLTAKYLHVNLDPQILSAIAIPALTPHTVTALVNFLTARGAAKAAATEALKAEAKAVFDAAVKLEVEAVLKSMTAAVSAPGGEVTNIAVSTT